MSNVSNNHNSAVIPMHKIRKYDYVSPHSINTQHSLPDSKGIAHPTPTDATTKPPQRRNSHAQN